MDYNHFILSLASSQIFNTNNYYELCKIHFPNIKEEDFFKDLQQAQNNLYSFSLKKNHQTILSSFHNQLQKLNLSGFILNTSDEYLNEYPAVSSFYINYLTGFSGSLALVIVLQNISAIFVDGRYTLQAQKEVNQNLFQILPLTLNSIKDFLNKNLNTKDIVGLNESNFTEKDIIFYQTTCNKANIKLINFNPLDEIWDNKPMEPISPLLIQPNEYQGDTYENKLKTIFHIFHQNSIKNYLITSPSNISWILNLKSQQIPNNPIPLCYALISNNNFTLYINHYLISPKIISYYKDITIKPNTELTQDLKELNKNDTLHFSNQTPLYFKNLAIQNNIKTSYDTNNIISNLKTIKNQKELSNIKDSHLQDSIILLELFYNIINQKDITHTELSISANLDSIKQNHPLYFCNSFTSIIGIDENGAIIHYKPTKETNKTLSKSSSILIDCGSHYLNGTTDITRSICFNSKNEDYNKYYTLVLKGHISLASSNIPIGNTFGSIDILARQFLTTELADYPHGTGHGVGYFNNVHEEPISLNSKNTTEIKEGMIFSIEPGYYKENHFGIRLENLYQASLNPLNPNFFKFIPLTYFPFSISNIQKSLLSQKEINWINNYHKETKEKLIPLIKSSHLKDFLIEITKTL
jgi:Xaa-Pro aminopeptidase